MRKVMTTGEAMARNKLSETKIKALTKPGIYGDGDGLFLRVRAGGSRQWVFIYKRAGKRVEIGLGGYGQGTAPVPLALAREKADEVRARLARGEDLATRKTFADVIPAIMAKLRASDAVSARAVEFTALTASRSGEVRGAVWSEIDFAQAVWIVPAERMKAGREHRVPLTGRMLAILEERKQVATGDLIFEGGKEGAAISDTAMVKILRAASEDKTITLHGLRSSFRDWAGDTTGHPREVAEAALAHAVGDVVEQAYRRSDALAKRRGMMEDWTEYCETKVSTVSKS